MAGEPVITVEGMKAHTSSSLPEQQESMFWACVERFTSAERSRLLKFATGRIRLPVKLVVEAYSGCVANLITDSARNATHAHVELHTCLPSLVARFKFAQRAKMTWAHRSVDRSSRRILTATLRVIFQCRRLVPEGGHMLPEALYAAVQ